MLLAQDTRNGICTQSILRIHQTCMFPFAQCILKMKKEGDR